MYGQANLWKSWSPSGGNHWCCDSLPRFQQRACADEDRRWCCCLTVGATQAALVPGVVHPLCTLGGVADEHRRQASVQMVCIPTDLIPVDSLSHRVLSIADQLI
jgi:hypothetical protein